MYLALLFNAYLGSGDVPKGATGAPQAAPVLPAFVDNWKGSLCFLGEGTAALQLPVGTYVGGFPFTLVWKMVYLQLQLNARATWRCCEGWLQTAIFGRDIQCAASSPKDPKETQ